MARRRQTLLADFWRIGYICVGYTRVYWMVRYACGISTWNGVSGWRKMLGKDTVRNILQWTVTILIVLEPNRKGGMEMPLLNCVVYRRVGKDYTKRYILPMDTKKWQHNDTNHCWLGTKLIVITNPIVKQWNWRLQARLGIWCLKYGREIDGVKWTTKDVG